MHALAAWILRSAPLLARAPPKVLEYMPLGGKTAAETQHLRRRVLRASSGPAAGVLPALLGGILLQGTVAAPDGPFASTLSVVDMAGAQLPELSQPTHPPFTGDNHGQLALSPVSVAAAAALMLLCGAVSVQLSLGLHKTIALATLRCSHHLLTEFIAVVCSMCFQQPLDTLACSAAETGSGLCLMLDCSAEASRNLIPTQSHHAAFRAFVQVLLLGLLLAPVLGYRHWWVLLAACGAMLALASAEAASRPRHSYQARHVP